MSQLSSRARVELAKAALSRIGLESPELRPYQDEPAQMPSGTVGKDGYLRLEFADRGDRSVMAFMDRRVPFLVQRALYWDEAMPQMPCIFIITTTGCVLQGDRMALEIEVGKNAQAHVTTQSATKVHCRGGRRLSGVHARSAHPAPYFALPQQDPAFRRGNREPALRRSRAAGAEIPP